MSTKIADEILNDPIALAVAVLVDRVRGLSKEDKDDLFELTEAMANARTDEEYDAAARGMREILKQQESGMQAMPSVEPSEELRTRIDRVGSRIRLLRERAGLTQEQLAEKSGLLQSHISRLERGHHSPSFVTLERIASALAIEVSEFDPPT
jgi:ribosome-binding protein aMBF1 (putative translation factor)